MGSQEERARKRKEIRRIVRDTPHLPTIPTIMLELEQVLREPDPKDATIAQIIAKDVSTASRLLKVVNSSPAYAGALTESWDIAEAVRQVGIKEIRRLASTLSVVRVFPDALTHLDYTGFWKHSLGVAGASRLLGVLSYRAVKVDPDEAYTAGLLHDIGCLLLDQYLPNQAGAIVEHSKKHNVPRMEAEKEVLGTDHGEIGGMLLERWRLPAEIVEGVSWHHNPDLATDRGKKIAHIVHIADFVCRAFHVGDSDKPLDEEFPIEDFLALGFAPQERATVIEGLVGAARVMADIIVHLPPGFDTTKYPVKPP